MFWLVLGVLMWSLSHYFKRLAPKLRAALGNRGKALVALCNVTAIVLMVIGYKSVDTIVLWDFGSAAKGINNILMVVAVILFGVGGSKSHLREKMRHPMLTGALVWVAAHLLVNGDVGSVVLFGGLGLWALGAIVLINRAEPKYVRWTQGTGAGDIRLLAISAVLFAVIAGIHMWVGPSPFGA